MRGVEGVEQCPAVEAKELGKSFPVKGTKAPRIVAAHEVSFTVPRGGALGIVGESGSGKSTISRMIAGLERPESGELFVNGEDRLHGRRGRHARRERAQAVQMVFQDPNSSLDPRLTAAGALHHALRLQGMRSRAKREAKVESLVESVGLTERDADQLPQNLSGGQCQRVAIARALAAESTVLVLDEAVSALDVSVQAQILQLLNRLRRTQQIAYIFVSHDLAVVEEVTDDVLVLYGGEAVEQGPTREILNSPRHPYTQMLRSSIPSPGWDPAEVAKLRAKLAEDLSRV